MTKEALRLALGALQRFIKYDYNENPFDGKDVEGAEAITAIKEALAQPEQEPVAWMFQHNETGRMSYVSNDGLHNPTTFIEMNPRYALVCPLYTTPPQRTWVGLTDEEVGDLSDFAYANDEEFVRNVEKYLKEKNNG